MFPPFPSWEVVLTSETFDPAIASGLSLFDELMDFVTRSIIDSEISATSLD